MRTNEEYLPSFMTSLRRPETNTGGEIVSIRGGYSRERHGVGPVYPLLPIGHKRQAAAVSRKRIMKGAVS